MLVHTTTADTTGSARPGSVNHSIWWPSRVLTAPSVGARIHRHSTAIANGAQIHGSTYSVRKKPVPGSARANIAAAARPSTVCTGTTIAMKAKVTSSEVRNDASVSTD